MLILTSVSRFIPFIVGILIAFLVGYVSVIVFRKLSKKLTFLVPIFFLAVMVLFAILGFISTDWGRLGYLIFASLGFIALIGSVIASWVNKKA